MPKKISTPKNRVNQVAFRIASRYLFSKKSHNAINIISAISAIGIGVAAMALICVLSVFNGFEQLIAKMYSEFDPDLKITLVEGKSFNGASPGISHIKQMPEVINYTDVLQDNALLRYKNKQMPAIVKGVSNGFLKMHDEKKIVYDGSLQLFDGAFERVVAGVGIANILGVGAHFIDPLYIDAPKRTGRINMLRPENSFVEVAAFVSGIFQVKQQQYDDNYVLVSINLARQLFGYGSHEVSYVELQLSPKADKAVVQKKIQKLLGADFHVKNRFEQQEGFFKIMQIEKWITYLILSFIMLIASFNIIGSLSMLIIDKRDDILTLRNLGASNQLIKRIFLIEGWLIAFVGAIFGLLLGNLLCLIQEYLGVIKLGNDYVVDAYPVLTNFSDSLLVFVTVLAMGFLAAYYPVKYISNKSGLLND